jgi:hypothetical protein
MLAGCAVALGGESWWLVDSKRRDRQDVAEADALRATIERNGGFRIITDHLQALIGPSVILPSRPVMLADLGRHQLGPFRSIASALPPYPAGVLARLIGTVALAAEVTFWRDTAVGGFFFPKGICLNAGNAADAGSVTTRLFHHELSSLVRMAAPFDATRWQALNPPGFRYLDEAAYRSLLKNRPHQAGDPGLWRQGFVRPYGTSDLDNDFNTYAEAALSDGPAFAATVQRYSSMQAKLALLISTYEALDIRFSGYFRRTGLATAAIAVGRPT